MQPNKTLLIASVLVVMSLIPQGIAIYQFFHNGGLGWHMQWGNEKLVWSAIFSILAMIGLLMVIRIRKNAPVGSLLVIICALLIIAGSFIALVSHGVGPASKGDDEQLQLNAFWSSDWWK